MTYEESAAGPVSALSALYYLRRGGIRSGHTILINGASGALGTAAVQLAKHFGADVTGVCSTTNLEMVQSIGADRVIDYTKEDFTKEGQTYDIIYDAVEKSSFSKCKSSLSQKGIYLSTVATILLLLQTLRTSKIGSKKAIFMLSPFRIEDLIFLKDIIEERKVKTVIDRCYPLSQTAEAHRYVGKGHAKGKVVITL